MKVPASNPFDALFDEDGGDDVITNAVEQLKQLKEASNGSKSDKTKKSKSSKNGILQISFIHIAIFRLRKIFAFFFLWILICF